MLLLIPSFVYVQSFKDGGTPKKCNFAFLDLTTWPASCQPQAQPPVPSPIALLLSLNKNMDNFNVALFFFFSTPRACVILLDAIFMRRYTLTKLYPVVPMVRWAWHSTAQHQLLLLRIAFHYEIHTYLWTESHVLRHLNAYSFACQTNSGTNKKWNKNQRNINFLVSLDGTGRHNDGCGVRGMRGMIAVQ